MLADQNATYTRHRVPPRRTFQHGQAVAPRASGGVRQGRYQTLQRADGGLVDTTVDALGPEVALERRHHQLGPAIDDTRGLDAVAIAAEQQLHLRDHRNRKAEAKPGLRSA